MNQIIPDLFLTLSYSDPSVVRLMLGKERVLVCGTVDVGFHFKPIQIVSEHQFLDRYGVRKDSLSQLVYQELQRSNGISFTLFPIPKENWRKHYDAITALPVFKNNPEYIQLIKSAYSDPR